MDGAVTHDARTARGWRPPSVHFVNNVLAAAAGAIEEDPVLARDTLARLGDYLTTRLREPGSVALAAELDLVETYLRLEEARFPGRLHGTVSHENLPAVTVAAGSVQAAVQELLSARLAERPGPCRVNLRTSGTALLLDLSDFPVGGAPDRHRLELGA